MTPATAVRKRGFSLIELIIVIIVLSLGLITILMAVRQSSWNNMIGHSITIAGQLADGAMEAVMAARKEGNFNSPDSYTPSPFTGYTITVNVATVDGPDDLDTTQSGTDYKRIIVTATNPVTGAGAVVTSVVTDY